MQKGEEEQSCPPTYVLALTNTMNVIHGKWKVPIIASLLRGKNRLKDLLDNIEKITPHAI